MPDRVSAHHVEIVLGEILVVVAAMLRLFAGFSVAIVGADRLLHPKSPVVALSLLTFVALIGFIAVASESLAAIAASGVDVIAAAASGAYKPKPAVAVGFITLGYAAWWNNLVESWSAGGIDPTEGSPP